MESQERNDQQQSTQENNNLQQPNQVTETFPPPAPTSVTTAPAQTPYSAQAPQEMTYQSAYQPAYPQNPYPVYYGQPQFVQNGQIAAKKNFFLRHWITIALGVAFLAVTGIMIYQAYFANYFHNQYDEANTLYQAEVKKTTALEDKLVELNVDKDELEAMNDQLDQKATTAQQEAAKLQGSLSAKMEELQKKQSELDTINKSLSSKKAELDKAQRGVAKFTEVEKLYASFKNKSDAFVVYSGDLISYLIKYMETGKESYLYAAQDALDEADAALDEMAKLNTQMNTIFDQIKAGNY